jgi:Ca2+-binding EF-hand superfamily protein
MKNTTNIPNRARNLGFFLTLTACSVVLAEPPAAEGGADKPKGPPSLGSGLLKRADTNTDGKISKEEMGAITKGDVAGRFDRMDTDKDGYIDSTELSKLDDMRKHYSEVMRRRGGPGEGKRPGGPGEGFGRGPRPEEAFKQMDADQNGEVTKEEFTTFAQKEVESRFTRLDEDKNGKVTFLEMEKMGRSMRPGGPPPGPEDFRRPPGDGERGPGFRKPPHPPEGADKPKEGDLPTDRPAMDAPATPEIKPAEAVKPEEKPADKPAEKKAGE